MSTGWEGLISVVVLNVKKKSLSPNFIKFAKFEMHELAAILWPPPRFISEDINFSSYI